MAITTRDEHNLISHKVHFIVFFQLQYAQNEDSKDQVEIVALLSMSAKEIEDSLKLAGQDIDDFNNALNRLQNQFDKLQDKLNEEQVGAHFIFNFRRIHDKKIQVNTLEPHLVLGSILE